MLFLKIIDKNNHIKFQSQGTCIQAEYRGELVEGDKISLSIDGGRVAAVRFSPCLEESIIYAPNKSFTFTIPSERELWMGYPPDAFKGLIHSIAAREVEDEEFCKTRNIALNSHDLRSKTGGYPHASANFVTREEPCFYERNAIDGEKNNQGHGPYPYHSWAGGARNDLEYTLDFGTEVEVDQLIFYLRADFKHDGNGVPHDSYWKSIDIQFDDGEIVKGEFTLDNTDLNPENSQGIAVVLAETKKTKKIKLFNFIQVTEKTWFCGVDANRSIRTIHQGGFK